jgi:hypothetical protein
MNREILSLQAARYAFGTSNTQEMQQLVNDLIDEVISYKAKYGNEAAEELKTLALVEARKWLEKYPEAGS